MPRLEIKEEKQTETMTTSASRRHDNDNGNMPRIYTQDDDPEFDDYDKEDADKDLYVYNA
jgi:hypothetical protein